MSKYHWSGLINPLLCYARVSDQNIGFYAVSAIYIGHITATRNVTSPDCVEHIVTVMSDLQS